MVGTVMAEDWREAFEAKTHEKDGATLRYRLASVGEETPRPLLLFLHGAGERGADNKAQLKHGAGPLLDLCLAEKQSCHILAPQCPRGTWWSNFDGDFRKPEALSLKAAPSAQMAMIFEVIDALVAEKKVDPARIYVTGLSMGGFGTFDAISRRPDFFAAAMPICGGGDAKQAPKFAKLPLWVFHGAKDNTVPVDLSRKMVEAIKAAGGEPKYTEFPNVAHNAWTPAYDDPELWKWMFAQRREE